MRGVLARLVGAGQRSVNTRPATAVLLGGDETLEVVGESYRQEELWRIVGGRQDDYVRFDVHAVLVPDDGNQHDRNAIEVRIDGTLVGYLSRDDAAHYRPGLLRAMQENGSQFVALHGVVCGGGPREDARIGFLGVFLDHDPADFGLPRHHISVGHLRTGLSQARATDLQDDSYDLSWLDSLPTDDAAAASALQTLLASEDEPIDRHYMFCELEHRLYRLRQSPSALGSFDKACELHHAEMATIREALREKFGVVPVIEVYRQAAIRWQKAKVWESARNWAERGLSVNGNQCARLEVVDDLHKRLAYAEAKIEASTNPPSAQAERKHSQHRRRRDLRGTRVRVLRASVLPRARTGPEAETLPRLPGDHTRADKPLMTHYAHRIPRGPVGADAQRLALGLRDPRLECGSNSLAHGL